jgi:hypothetical protein
MSFVGFFRHALKIQRLYVNVKKIGALLAALFVAVGTGSASATPLVGRDINRHAVAANDTSSVYLWDQDLGITWLRNANINGKKHWATQNTYAQNLVTGTGANAISDWRLPTTTDSGSAGCNFSFSGGTDCGFNVDTSGSEMAHLFHVTLGNLAIFNTSGAYRGNILDGGVWGLTNAGDFLDMQNNIYWSVEYSSNYAWFFATFNGNQSYDTEFENHFAMAVRSGDVLVAQVPEPESLVLALTGLAVLGLVRRRRAVGAPALRSR